MVKTAFRRVVLSRPWLTFVVLGASFFAFGAGTLNLFFLFKANAQFLASYGLMAALDGGLRQLFELLVTGYLSMAAYVVFKCCEHALVEHFAHVDEPDGVTAGASMPDAPAGHAARSGTAAAAAVRGVDGGSGR
jgi:hypothetical protein